MILIIKTNNKNYNMVIIIKNNRIRNKQTANKI